MGKLKDLIPHDWVMIPVTLMLAGLVNLGVGKAESDLQAKLPLPYRASAKQVWEIEKSRAGGGFRGGFEAALLESFCFPGYYFASRDRPIMPLSEFEQLKQTPWQYDKDFVSSLRLESPTMGPMRVQY